MPSKKIAIFVIAAIVGFEFLVSRNILGIGKLVGRYK